MRERVIDYYCKNIYPLGVLHSNGVNGKIAGSVAVAGEIADAIPIINSPRGCGFHYRYPARTKNRPVYKTECTCLEEKDIIFGTENRLRKTIEDTISRSNPAMVLIIPSPVSDILESNTFEIVKNMQKDYTCKLVCIKSSGFSQVRPKFLKEKELAYKRNERNLRDHTINRKEDGCGFSEAMNALVEQVMEPQKVIENSVNIESYSWLYGGRNSKSNGAVPLLHELGIKVNALLPSCNTSDIITAPRAKLNLISRSPSWPRHMKQRFGTEFLYVSCYEEYQSFEGLEQYYRMVCDYLGNQSENYLKLSKMKSISKEHAKTAKEYLNTISYLLYCEDYMELPNLLEKLILHYGLSIHSICLQMDKESLKNCFVYKKTIIETIRNITRKASVRDITVVINPNKNVLKEMIKETDVVINGMNLYKEIDSFRCIDLRTISFATSFEEMAHNIERIARLTKDAKSMNSLIINRLDVLKLKQDSNMDLPELSEILWNELWINRSEGGKPYEAVNGM